MTSSPAPEQLEAMRAAAKEAVNLAGGPTKLGNLLGISQAAVSQWEIVPLGRVKEVEKHSGVPRDRLRPDHFEAEPAKDAA